MFELHQKLIRLRAERPWMATARTAVAELSNESVLLVSRAAGGREHGGGDPSDDDRRDDAGPGNGALADHGPGPRVAVALNVSEVAVDLPLPAGGWTVGPGAGLLKDGRVVLPDHGWAVLLRD